MPLATPAAKHSPSYLKTDEPSLGAPDSAPESGLPEGPTYQLMLWLVYAVLVGLLIMFNYQLWLSDQGLSKARLLQAAVRDQTAENAALTERNSALEAEVKSLKQDLDAVEELARSEMGMIRQGETFYHILETPPHGDTPAHP